MKGQLLLPVGKLGGQGVEQLGRCEALVSLLDDQLPFFEHVQELDPHQRGLRCFKRLEPQHGTGDPLDGSMVLFHNIIQIFHLTDDDAGAVLLIVTLDGRLVGRTPIDGDLLRYAMALDRFGSGSAGPPARRAAL